MMRTWLSAAVVLFGTTSVLADQTSCSLDSHCPEETPCCSQYGQCGVGAYCLGGCDPRMSFSVDSCVPAPVCASKTLKMDNTDNIVDVSKYLGDPTKADWVAQGSAIPFNGNTLLTMKPETAGTVLASTVYLWYGNVKAKVKTGRGAGVVTAFILLSDVKDEIDYEWVGTELDIAQTNYYFQGIPDYTHSANITDVSDTNANFHEYEIQWTPDDITWLVDGKVGRVQKKSDTWNATANQWDFPQTPARLQLSIWPGGASTNAKGTVDWAGGPIDWSSADIKRDGYYYATFGDVDIECYQTNSPPGTNSGKSYTYKDARGTNNTIVDGDDNTVLTSLLGTGLNMTKELPASASGTSEVIPGLTGGGPGTNGEAAGGASSGDSSSSSGSSGSSSGSSSSGSGSTKCGSDSGFQQNCNSDSSTTSGGGLRQDHILIGSSFAAIATVFGAIWL